MKRYFRYTYFRLIKNVGQGWTNEPQHITDFSDEMPEDFISKLLSSQNNGEFYFRYPQVMVHEIKEDDYNSGNRYSIPVNEFTFYL